MNFLVKMNKSDLLHFCEAELEGKIQKCSSELNYFLENVGEFSCGEEELLEAIRIAPGTVMRQMLFAVYRYRNHVAIATGIGS